MATVKLTPSVFHYRQALAELVDEVYEENARAAADFDQDFWMPILINRDYFLLDGQHRLQVAKRMGLKFIDVVIDTERK